MPRCARVCSISEAGVRPFRAEVEAVLIADNIRFHIKETVLVDSGESCCITSADAGLMLRIAATHRALKVFSGSTFVDRSGCAFPRTSDFRLARQGK